MRKSLAELAILPFDVRYALSHGGSEFGCHEIVQLARPEFYGLAPYLAIKALDGEPNSQRELIDRLVQHFSRGNGYESLESVVMQHLNGSGIKVRAGKVAQINRIGPALVEEKFREFAEEAYKNGSTPVLLSYAALIGLRSFVEKYLSNNPKNTSNYKGGFFVIIPKFLGREFVGYTIRRNQEGIRVEHLSDLRDLTLCDVTLIDDTINSGSTIRNVLDFWRNHDVFPRTVTIRYIDIVSINNFLKNLSYYVTNKMVKLPKELENNA